MTLMDATRVDPGRRISFPGQIDVVIEGLRAAREDWRAAHPALRRLLDRDVEAAYASDPAARSGEGPMTHPPSSEGRTMTRTFLAVAAVALAASGSPALAKGCIKGAAVGAVSGHMVGKGHAVAGAAAGCAIGHHRAAKKAKTG